jgi:hypothetical protein
MDPAEAAHEQLQRLRAQHLHRHVREPSKGSAAGGKPVRRMSPRREPTRDDEGTRRMRTIHTREQSRAEQSRAEQAARTPTRGGPISGPHFCAPHSARRSTACIERHI